MVGPRGMILVVNQHGDSWSLPKGHIEKGEDGVAAARREIDEEAGVDRLRYVDTLGSYERFRIGLGGGEDRSELKSIKMYLFTTDLHALQPKDPKIPEARWMDKEEVAELLTHPRDKEFFRSVLNRL